MASPSTADFKAIIALSEKKDYYLAEAEKIQAQINSILSGNSAAPAKRGRKPKATTAEGQSAPAKKAKVGRTRRGGIKEAIVALLHEAGEAGIAVKDIAEKVGKKAQNIHVWFATTGKAVGAKKVAPGVYALSESGPGNGAPAAELEAAPAPVAAKSAKKPAKAKTKVKKAPKKK
jgi:hypothetical protein